MLNPAWSSPLGRYVGQVREWGFDAMGLYADPEGTPEAMRAFATCLKENGARMMDV